MGSKVNNRAKQIIVPSNAVMGIQPIFGLTLNGLSSSGFLFRKIIRLRFTSKNVINTPKTVAFATKVKSPRKISIIVKPMVRKTAIVGVRRFGEILANDSGKALSLAIPYIILDVTIRIIRTVFAVAKRAINDIIIPPGTPKTADATAFRGSGEPEIILYGKILTTEIAVKQ
jgi:hypothetical protein